jgi:hypothetical protein
MRLLLDEVCPVELVKFQQLVLTQVATNGGDCSCYRRRLAFAAAAAVVVAVVELEWEVGNQLRKKKKTESGLRCFHEMSWYLRN